MVAAATVVVCTLYIYSAVCMMLRIAILIAGWLSCHRPLWCMTASVHSPHVRTSEAHNISLCRWMADSQDVSHGRSSSSTFIFFNFYFSISHAWPAFHLKNLARYLYLFIVIIHPYLMWGLPQVCDMWTSVASGTHQKSYFKIFLWLLYYLYLYLV